MGNVDLLSQSQLSGDTPEDDSIRSDAAPRPNENRGGSCWQVDLLFTRRAPVTRSFSALLPQQNAFTLSLLLSA